MDVMLIDRKDRDTFFAACPDIDTLDVAYQTEQALASTPQQRNRIDAAYLARRDRIHADQLRHILTLPR